MAASKTAQLDDLLVQDAGEQSVAPDTLSRITTTAHELRAVRKQLEETEAQVEELKKKERSLSEEVLPNLMDEAGVKELTLDEGSRLVREEAVYAHISEANMEAACKWLIKNGYGGIVKNAFEIMLPRGATKEAEKIRKLLTQGHVPFDYAQQIHGQTLRAFAKESVEAGRELPKTISIHVQPVVKIKEPKTSRKSRGKLS